MAVVHVVYGKCMFSNNGRRNSVVRQWTRAGGDAGFVPSSLVQGYGPGMVQFEHVATDDQAPDLTPGTTYASVHFAFEHPDSVLVDQARDIMLEEIATIDWLYGDVGTARFYRYDRNPSTG